MGCLIRSTNGDAVFMVTKVCDWIWLYLASSEGSEFTTKHIPTVSGLYPNSVHSIQPQHNWHTAAIVTYVISIAIRRDIYVTPILIEIEIAIVPLIWYTVPCEEVRPGPWDCKYPICHIVPSSFVCDDSVVYTVRNCMSLGPMIDAPWSKHRHLKWQVYHTIITECECLH